MSALFVNLLKEDLNEELYMAKEAGLGLDLFLSKVTRARGGGGNRHASRKKSVPHPLRYLARHSRRRWFCGM